jgi:hypothetical protein
MYVNIILTDIRWLVGMKIGPVLRRHAHHLAAVHETLLYSRITVNLLKLSKPCK